MRQHTGIDALWRAAGERRVGEFLVLERERRAFDPPVVPRAREPLREMAPVGRDDRAGAIVRAGRHDLIPNLVETVKGYAAHERGTLEAVIQARNTAVAAQGPAAQAAAENMLSGALRQLFALSESYPDLKANANFQQLQAELTDIENKIAAARRFFNNSVSEYNTGIQQFPAALFAGIFGFTQRPFFELGDDRKAVEQAPQVKF